MLLTDVNVLVYALRIDVADHARYKGWLEDMVTSESAFAVSDQVLSGFVRVATHPASQVADLLPARWAELRAAEVAE